MFDFQSIKLDSSLLEAFSVNVYNDLGLPLHILPASKTIQVY